MAKQGMKRPDETHPRKKNDLPPVPELQGKAKRTKEQAGPFLPQSNLFFPGMMPMPPAYPDFFTDLARDNGENDLTAADRQDL